MESTIKRQPIIKSLQDIYQKFKDILVIVETLLRKLSIYIPHRLYNLMKGLLAS